MSVLADWLIGIYHFAADRPPGNVPVVDPRPRAVNPWQQNGEVLVSRVSAGKDITASTALSVELLGGLGRAIARGDTVLVKPNFNSPDPVPASTDLAFLRAAVEILLDAGAKVIIGESAGALWRPTRRVLRKLGADDLARDLGVELIAFDDRPADWVRIRIQGDYLESVCMPRAAYEADRLVYLPCMKTHKLARFTGALKLAVGFMHPGERRSLHMGNLEEKAAELSLCWQPELIIMDGRKAFVSGGPDKGRVEEPGILLASGDLVAIDVEAMKTLLAHGAGASLPPNPWHSRQIATATKHGLGASEGGYTVVQ